MSNIKLVHSGGNSVSLTTPSSNPSSNVTFKLPAADGTAGQVLQSDGNGNLTFVDPPGISMLDTWALTSQKTLGAGSVVYMNSDFDRVTHVATGRIGGAMTKNGDGMFSFPSTGIYEIDFQLKIGDVVLLCSDGLYNEIGDEYIKKKMQDGISAESLVSEVLLLNPKDNVSAIVINLI